MLKSLKFLTIISQSSARFLQEEDEATCLDNNLKFFADSICQDCESGLHADELGTACITETCDPESDTPHLDLNGYCIRCSDNTKFVETSKTCHADECLLNEVFQTSDGTCKKCPE